MSQKLNHTKTMKADLYNNLPFSIVNSIQLVFNGTDADGEKQLSYHIKDRPSGARKAYIYNGGYHTLIMQKIELDHSNSEIPVSDDYHLYVMHSNKFDDINGKFAIKSIDIYLNNPSNQGYILSQIDNLTNFNFLENKFYDISLSL